MTEALTPGTPDLAALLLDAQTLEVFLQALAESALVMAPGADGCGITLERQNHPLTVVSAGVSAPPLDEAQYGQDDGPCLEALREGHEVSVGDMRLESRWNGCPAFAVAAGTRSSLSLPIAAHSHTAGALNLYSPQAKGFEEADLGGLRATWPPRPRGRSPWPNGSPTPRPSPRTSKRLSSHAR